MRALLSCFFIILREVDLESVSPSVTWNLSVQDGENLQLKFQMQLSERRKAFCHFFLFLFFFFFHFWNLHQILNRLNKRTIVLANVFPKLQTVKNLVRLLSKKRRFTTRFDSQHVKGSQMLAKSPWQHIYHFFSIILWEVHFENVSLSDRWNLTGFS